jgi:hypothetical protein
MADIAEPRFTPILLAALSDESAAIRQASARGLGSISASDANRERAAEALVRQLSSEADRGVRLALINALGRLGAGPNPLNAVYSRTNPTNEPDESVRRRAWDTLIELLKRADKSTQLAWSTQLAASKDPAAAPRRIELLTAVETRARAEKWPEKELASVSEQLADLLADSKREGEAIPRYEELYRKLSRDKSPRASAVATKMFRALLSSDRIDKALALWTERAAAGDPDSGGALADAMLAHLESLLDKSDAGSPRAAADLVQRIRKALPQASKSAAWSARLNGLADRADKALAEELAQRVKAQLDRMVGPDKAAADAARKALEQMGAEAVPALLDELARTIDGDDKLRPREKAIASLLAGSPCKATDYDAAAPADRKKTLLAVYRKRWDAYNRSRGG